MPNPARCPVLPDRSRLARRARGFRVRLKSGTTTQTLPSRSTSSPPPRPLPLLIGPLSPPRSPCCLSRTALTAFLNNSLHSATSLLESAIERSHFYVGGTFPYGNIVPTKSGARRSPVSLKILQRRSTQARGVDNPGPGIPPDRTERTDSHSLETIDPIGSEGQQPRARARANTVSLHCCVSSLFVRPAFASGSRQSKLSFFPPEKVLRLGRWRPQGR